MPPVDMTDKDVRTYMSIRRYTMASPARIFALIRAVKYIAQNRIPGAIVECGVAAGGSVVAIARTLVNQGVLDRTIYLYDTFAGMPKPSKWDIGATGIDARIRWAEVTDGMDTSKWCRHSRRQVRVVVYRKAPGYPKRRYKFVVGKVEDTLPTQAPEAIALLKLDTDWYASTKHELEHLYPRLVRGGVLMIDDYGRWRGARKAVDDYFARLNPMPFLHAVDFTGRIAVKP